VKRVRRGPAQNDRKRLLPAVARAFAELGYRRATTAQLARCCRVRENVLYRAWPSKRAMFLASIDYVFQNSLQTWRALLTSAAGARADDGSHDDGSRGAQRVLEYESLHHGEFGLYRIVFAALNESRDPEVRAALRDMYVGFHAFLISQLCAARPVPDHRRSKRSCPINLDQTAWALVGLGTVVSIARELDLLRPGRRRALMRRVGDHLLKGAER
jgi:AcrR family transcriptional regulator